MAICSSRRFSASQSPAKGVSAVGSPLASATPMTRSPPNVFAKDEMSARNSERSLPASP
jgi:hypothetical protein